MFGVSDTILSEALYIVTRLYDACVTLVYSSFHGLSRVFLCQAKGMIPRLASGCMLRPVCHIMPAIGTSTQIEDTTHIMITCQVALSVAASNEICYIHLKR